MQFLAKKDLRFREASRREDAALLRLAVQAPTQTEMARNGKRITGASERQIINWMKCEHDMPSWAVKAVRQYLEKVDSVARRIEGRP